MERWRSCNPLMLLSVRDGPKRLILEGQKSKFWDLSYEIKNVGPPFFTFGQNCVVNQMVVSLTYLWRALLGYCLLTNLNVKSYRWRHIELAKHYKFVKNWSVIWIKHALQIRSKSWTTAFAYVYILCNAGRLTRAALPGLRQFPKVHRLM